MCMYYFLFDYDVGVDKQKNLQGEARNRRVLKDIGNLVADRAVVQGKPVIQRPVTR